jgi:DNA polymerase (family X)
MTLKNTEISILGEIGFLLEMDNEVTDKKLTNANIFKARSYKRASDITANLSSNVEEIYRKEGVDGLLHIPSVGKAIASRIEEYLITGKTSYFEELKSKTPINSDEFTSLECIGIGPKTR